MESMRWSEESLEPGRENEALDRLEARCGWLLDKAAVSILQLEVLRPQWTVCNVTVQCFFNLFSKLLRASNILRKQRL